MKYWIMSAALVAAVCAGVVWVASSAAPTPQDLVDARVAGMKKMGGDVKAALNPAAAPAEAKAKLAEAAVFAGSISSKFPKGTGIGDPGVTKSRALQDIWAKPAEFKAAADALVAVLKTVDAALDSGDRAKIDLAAGEVGKSCGGCHKPFRGPEIE